MTKHINVGFDDSAASFEAVLWAADEANSRGARLRVISSYPVPVTSPVMFDLPAADAYISLLDETHANLQSVHARIAESHPDLDVETVGSSDPAASALIAGVSADDLVVVGSSNHPGAMRLLLGNTARQVVRHSPCPVAVIPGPGTWDHTERIVVGVDGSPTSRRALLWAADEADRSGATLLVVHAWMYPYLHAYPDSSQARDLTQVDAACMLDREVECVREQFAAVVTGRLIECSPSAALLNTVRRSDMLVLGSNGHGAIHSTLCGSTVSTVLDRSAVPTVVVRSS